MSKIEIIPRKKWIYVTQDAEESRITEGGLSTPDNVEQERKSVGTVVAVGNEVTDLKPGDRIVFGAFAGEKSKIEKEDLEILLVHDDDVIAIAKGL